MDNDTSTFSLRLPTELETLTSLLRTLSSDLVQSRTATHDPSSGPTTNGFEPHHFLTTSAPIFAALHALNRNTLGFNKECKGRTHAARLEMDSAHLRLQNLMFERNHLETEIRKCDSFSSTYQNLPLLPASEFLLLTQQDPAPPSLSEFLPLPELSEAAFNGGHADGGREFMLARLGFELSERKRYDEERKELQQEKSKLVKQNEAKKLQLEDLENKVDQFVASAKEIQSKLHAA